MPPQHIAYGSETLSAGLLESPEPESRNLAYGHTGEGEVLRLRGEPPTYNGIMPELPEFLSEGTMTKKTDALNFCIRGTPKHPPSPPPPLGGDPLANTRHIAP